MVVIGVVEECRLSELGDGMNQTYIDLRSDENMAR